jgi:hypothetical protein
MATQTRIGPIETFVKDKYKGQNPPPPSGQHPRPPTAGPNPDLTVGGGEQMKCTNTHTPWRDHDASPGARVSCPDTAPPITRGFVSATAQMSRLGGIDGRGPACHGSWPERGIWRSPPGGLG